MKKEVPIEKVFEAWTALADHRVIMKTEPAHPLTPTGEDSAPEGNLKETSGIKAGEAQVSSSDGEKVYTVRWAGNQYSSDDNATFWQGYPGYPVIAVLMLRGILPFDEKEATLWKNINWTQQNKKFKNNYAEAVADIAKERGINLEKSYEEARKVRKILDTLPIEIKRKIKI